MTNILIFTIHDKNKDIIYFFLIAYLYELITNYYYFFFFRKLETEELQKIQLQNQLDRATDRIAR